MNYEIFDRMLLLLRAQLDPASKEQAGEMSLSEEELKQLYALSKSHDLAHMVSASLGELSLLPADHPALPKLQKQQMLAVYRYQRIQYEYAAICKVLSEASVDHLPLKGSILRDFYPAPWMRTSCDIDILVRVKDLESAADLLVRELQYEKGVKGHHDISLRSPSGVHLELHFDLNEDDFKHFSTLERVWELSAPHEADPYLYVMPPEVFYFYHIAHMAKHFVYGGCGVKPFIDLWILDQKYCESRDRIDALLNEEGLLSFSKACQRLSRVWFSGEPAEEIDHQVATFVLEGGVYGSMDHHLAVEQKKKGGRLSYALSRIFHPYHKLKIQFPILEKHRWLTPFCQIVRWFRLIFQRGRLKSSVRELALNQSVSREQVEETAELLCRLGLQK